MGKNRPISFQSHQKYSPIHTNANLIPTYLFLKERRLILLAKLTRLSKK
jgi:hypothetical protein